MISACKMLGLCVLGALALAVCAAEVKTPPLTLPDKTVIRHLALRDPMFGDTMCYIIAGKTGQAIIIDPADKLELTENKILVDAESGETTVLNPSEMKDKYESADWLTVTDPATGRKKHVFDQFRPTGAYGPQICKVLKDNKLTLKYIVLTHGHMDHIGSVKYVMEKTKAQILMHAGDVREGYPKDAYRLVGGMPKVARTLSEGEVLTLDGMALQVIHTPGHSPGSICLRTSLKGRPILFSGDTLLYHSVGRTNFRDGSGDEELLFKNIRTKLLTLPDNTLVYTAHTDFFYFKHFATTIGDEKRLNPFLQLEYQK
ncbi:MAG: MBL fold metallo-hydrolase [Armatimonadota bacterium]